MLKRKDVSQLTDDDLRACAIWELMLREKAVGPNEGEVRPRPDLAVHDSSVGTGVFAVRTSFRLADDTTAVGYCSPVPAAGIPRDDILGYLAPAIVSARGQVPFHVVLEHDPGEADVAWRYELLGRRPETVFPVEFAVDVPVASGETGSGVIESFGFIVYKDGRFSHIQLR